MDPIAIISLVLAALGIPAAVIGIMELNRYLRRRNLTTQSELDKERAYLFALQGYLEEIERPTQFLEDEFTPLAGSLLEREHVALRYLVRSAMPQDQLGLQSPDIAPTSKGQHVTDVVDLITNSHRAVIILGEPGSGKSVTMRRIALETARTAVQRLQSSPRIPIYLHLGAYKDTTAEGRPITIGQFIQAQLRDVIPGGCNLCDLLPKLLMSGRMMLLFDSMDEMQSSDFTDRAGMLQSFLAEHSGLNLIVVACRRREYSGTFRHSELIIEPFDSKRIRQYLVQQWKLYAKTYLTPELRDTLYKSYLAIAAPDHPLNHFATNPFSLNLLAKYIFRTRGVLPSKLSQIFENYIREKLRREKERDLTNTSVEAITTALKALAYGTIQSFRGTYLHRSECQSLIASLSGMSNVVIVRCVDRAIACGLLRCEADQSVRFEHHRLVEYLAASFWEQRSDGPRLDVSHLDNPWWRETIMLRAGISTSPDGLVGQLCTLIESYRAAGLDRGVIGALDRLVRVELVLACARQCWTELSASIQARVLSVANSACANAGTLESVRLARAIRGLPLDRTWGILEPMAKSTSDWLVSEVFASIDPEGYDSEGCERIVSAFMSVASTDIFVRIRVLRALPVRHVFHMKSQRRLLGLILLRSAIGAGFWVALIALVWKFNLNDPTNLVSGATASVAKGTVWLLLIVAGVAVWASLRIALWIAVVFGAMSLVFSPVTTTVGFVAVSGVFMLVGSEYLRAVWLKNRALRLLKLVTAQGMYTRVIIAAGSAWFIALAVGRIMRQGFVVSGWLGDPRPIAVGRWVQATGFISALVFECACRVVYAIRLKLVLRKGTTSLDPEVLAEVLAECIAELRQPRPVAYLKRILDRITELPAVQPEAVGALKELLDSGQYFLPADLILETIDRLDLRQRQRAFEVVARR